MTVSTSLVVKIVNGIRALEHNVNTAEALHFNLDADVSAAIEELMIAGPVSELEAVADAIIDVKAVLIELHNKLGDIAEEHGIEIPKPGPGPGGIVIQGGGGGKP